MKIVQINSGNFGSTGTIMLSISEAARNYGDEVWITCPDSRDNRKKKVENQKWIGTRFERNLHLFLTSVTGFNGLFSYFSTRRYLKEIEKEAPDLIHFHNLHNCYINLPLLFNYIKKNNIKVIWTLHDCWSFTGQCPHFILVKCDKWKKGCYKCPSTRDYPATYVDRTNIMWKLKKKWFTGVRNLTIVTPSWWLAGLVKQSFLKDYPVRVIHNGIDLSIFKPSESDFREKYRCQNKFILLGVAFDWGKRKGLDVFINLAHQLDLKYQIVLVGTNEAIDVSLPENIISIHRTQNQRELAEIYTAADLFVNPTREENYPTVNMEALACGTPVLTFKTGGSAEILDETCGSIVPCDEMDTLVREIIRICKEKPYSREACIKRAKSFEMNERFKEYIDLYWSV